MLAEVVFGRAAEPGGSVFLASTVYRVWHVSLWLNLTDTNGSRSRHEPLFPEQTYEVLRLNGMKGDDPLVEVRTNDGSIKHGYCTWVDFAHMSQAWEVYLRGEGETFNPGVKLMILIYRMTGKQTRRHWYGRMIVANPAAVDRIESYQGLRYGTMSGGDTRRPLAVALVKGKRVKVMFPSFDVYRHCNGAGETLRERLDIERSKLNLGEMPSYALAEVITGDFETGPTGVNFAHSIVNDRGLPIGEEADRQKIEEATRDLTEEIILNAKLRLGGAYLTTLPSELYPRIAPGVSPDTTLYLSICVTGKELEGKDSCDCYEQVIPERPTKYLDFVQRDGIRVFLRYMTKPNGATCIMASEQSVLDKFRMFRGYFCENQVDNLELRFCEEALLSSEREGAKALDEAVAAAAMAWQEQAIAATKM
ncbi:uncharacterized protein GIQ15_03637 [Arthroderma uncinatum]|uniref:uncharacterized protein n=1 Tax=Arthroderma uncinatum TaxID=74035 RepID=UPI00144AD50B|nr:uncharacterized protein GIQ15_03637 [Arthroderma uncinatum]KAF3484313.1 hypothetical protein GIQ15_03637 [Arthroderma uncinatum]